MDIGKIVDAINNKLAGELLTYEELEIFMDETIDDINAQLNSKYPAFSEFTAEAYPERYPNYNFFPERYVRTVVIPGSAFKFYAMDEEGGQSAPQYIQDYDQGLFYMLRDYSDQVPEEFKAEYTGSVTGIPNIANDPHWIREFGI